MQIVSISASLAMFSLVSLLLFPQTSFADGDWRSDHFYEKLNRPGVSQYGLYGGEFSRVPDSYCDPERRIDPRDRLFGGRCYYRRDYPRGYFGNGWGYRPRYGQGYGRGGWYCPPRYGYGRDNYYRGYRSPW